MTTIGKKHPSYGTSPPSMTLSENLISITSAVSRSLHRIISYLLSVDLLMWHLHVTILVVLNYGKRKSTFTFFEVVTFPAWVSHIFFSVPFDLSFDVRLPITIFEMLPLSNRISKFLNFSLPLRVFIQPCSIGE